MIILLIKIILVYACSPQGHGEVDSAKKEVAGLVSKIEVAKKQIEIESEPSKEPEKEIVKNVEKAVEDRLAVEQAKTKQIRADLAIAERRFGVFSDSSSMSVTNLARAIKSIANPAFREFAVSEARDTLKKKAEDVEDLESQKHLTQSSHPEPPK